MEYKTPLFTDEMKKDYTILLPNMAITQFTLLKACFNSEGYHAELLQNSGSEVSQLGLKYVHNDTCYPALLVIGQFIDALNKGNYDLHKVALIITQTGGGCRASNYLKLLRKALVKSGYGYIPVASLNFSNLEKESSIHLTPRFTLKMIAAIFYGDLLVALRNQVHPYETNRGDADKMRDKWLAIISNWIQNNSHYMLPTLQGVFEQIIKDFASIPVKKEKKVKVGIVGEIYVKFSPLGNNELEKFLESQDCEVNIPSLMGFISYCVANQTIDYSFYGGKKSKATISNMLLKIIDHILKKQAKVLRQYGFYAPGPFKEMLEKPKGIISLGVKMGEGWLLPAEMVELIEGGYPNIVCAQPFGCLPNHIVGKGVISKIRKLYPNSNITPIDYDPSATKVNQENRIKLMLAIAKENLQTTE